MFIGKEWCSVTLSFTLRLLLKLIVRAIHKWGLDDHVSFPAMIGSDYCIVVSLMLYL